MSVLFDGSTDYFTLTGSPIGALDTFTFGAWFYPHNNTANKFIQHHHTNSGSTQSYMMTARDSNNLRFVSYAGSADTMNSTDATPSSTYTVNAWNIGFCVKAADNDREVQIDDDNAATDTSTSNPNTMTHHNIGRHASSTSTYFDGELACLFVYNIALSVAERNALAAGFSPLLVRPEALVCYVPMLAYNDGDDLTDLITGNTYSANGSPVQGTSNPAIIHPSAQILAFPPSDGAPPVTASQQYYYYESLLQGSHL